MASHHVTRWTHCSPVTSSLWVSLTLPSRCSYVTSWTSYVTLNIRQRHGHVMSILIGERSGIMEENLLQVSLSTRGDYNNSGNCSPLTNWPTDSSPGNQVIIIFLHVIPTKKCWLLQKLPSTTIFIVDKHPGQAPNHCQQLYHWQFCHCCCSLLLLISTAAKSSTIYRNSDNPE